MKTSTTLTNNKVFKYFIKPVLILLFWILVWEIISLIVNKPLLFPNPLSTVKRLCELIITKEFLVSVLFSILRTVVGIVISVFLGILMAVLCYKIKLLYEIFYPFVTVIRTTPVASFVILIWIFIGNSITPVVITSVIVFPIIFSNILEGLKNLDNDLVDVIKVYKINRINQFKAFYIPSLLPYFKSGLITSIGMGWKAGIAAEVLCTPIRSIGKYIFESKIYFEYTDLFAWTLTIIVLSFVFEKLSKTLIKKILSNNKLEKANAN